MEQRRRADPESAGDPAEAFTQCGRQDPLFLPKRRAFLPHLQDPERRGRLLDVRQHLPEERIRIARAGRLQAPGHQPPEGDRGSQLAGPALHAGRDFGHHDLQRDMVAA